MNKLWEYTKWEDKPKFDGWYKIYVKGFEDTVYIGISQNVYTRIGNHKSRIKNFIKKDLDFAVSTYNMSFKNAFAQKLLMLLISGDKSLNDIVVEWSDSYSDKEKELQEIKDNESDFRGFNGPSFHSREFMEEYKEFSKKEIDSIIDNNIERFNRNKKRMLPHNYWAMLGLDYLPKEDVALLQKQWEEYCDEVSSKLKDWTKNNSNI